MMVDDKWIMSTKAHFARHLDKFCTSEELGQL